jgi:REP element-mobilizing transposase RayT
MPHSYTHLLSHVIFSTKGRVPGLDAKLRERLFPYMGGIICELGGDALVVNGTMDHIHLLILLPPTRAVADAMRVLKTNSSRWIHETWASRRGFAWQTGYGAFSVSRSGTEEIRRYIENQEEHHRRMTFEEELVALLERHGLAYDEHYLGD